MASYAKAATEAGLGGSFVDAYAASTQLAASNTVSEGSVVTYSNVSYPSDSSIDAHTGRGAGGFSVYDSHPAQVIFSATSGGSVHSGSAVQGAGSESVTEDYADSLVGASQGATATAYDGYHFLWWRDDDTGDVLSSSAFFVPERPESGWSAAWNIVAVFERDAYLLILDANGGSISLRGDGSASGSVVSGGGGGGGGSGGAYYTQLVEVGGTYTLPSIGEDLDITRYGSAFSGWNAVASPDREGASRAYALADGATIDAANEAALVRLGNLDLVWNGIAWPTLTLYAQWNVGQVTITYRAGDGGSVLANDATVTKSEGLAFEVIASDVASGSAESAPKGAEAVSALGHHFSGWETTGVESLSSDDAVNASLSSSAVASVSRFADAEGLPDAYHAATFAASFAPNSYSIVYSANGGTGSARATSVTYGSTATLASSGVSRTGYRLSGWSTSASTGGTSYALGATVDASTLQKLISQGSLADEDGATVTLYAQWTANGSGSGSSGNSGSGSGSNGGSGSNSGSNANGPATNITPTKGNTPGKSNASGSGATPGSTSAGTRSGSTATYSSSRAISSRTAFALPSALAESVEDAVEEAADVAADALDELPEAVSALVDPTRVLSELPPVVLGATAGQDAAEEATSSIFGQMSAAEAIESTGTAVAAVAAVGALVSLVGIGASFAGATAAGAAALGTATTIGLTSAADMAADLAAESAASGAAAAGKRRRRDDDDEEAS